MRLPLYGLMTFLTITGIMPLPAAPHPVPAVQDTETKEQRDTRMAWWREARFGMFIHWGLYAVPAGAWRGRDQGGIGEWIMHDLEIPMSDYKALASGFDPKNFDADAWVSVAKAAGMKYIVITAKHHDGFAMFKSKAHSFNIVDATPFKRDPLKELAAACQKQGMKLGFYYSQDQDWTAPGGVAVGGHWDTAQDGDFAEYLKTKAIPQMEELLNNYQPYPAVIWFDTPTGDMTPELAGQIVALLNKHPNIIWNNRLGGGYEGDTATPEQYIPPQGFPGRDWETCMTINNTWGYKSKDTNFKSTETLLRNLIDIASKGGNYLLNVGPTPLGEIPQPEVDRLREIGHWLNANGEAIYGTTANPFPRINSLPWGRATQKAGKLYLHVFNWPTDGKLLVPIENQPTKAWLLVKPDEALPISSEAGKGVIISLPTTAPDPIASVIVLDVGEPVMALPPSPVKFAVDGSLPLYVEDAELMGSLSLNGGDVKNIGGWINAKDYVEWTARITRPGIFDVGLNYALDPGSAGSEVRISVDDQSVNVSPEITKTWSDYKTVMAGRLKIEKTGLVKIKVEGTKKPGQAVINLRSVTLTPIVP